MKIEKINDNQIRCTLSKHDLDLRQIKLSELAYGTKKANQLFHEMMSFAEQHFDFDSQDMPLMVEAIPCADDSITIIITKVNYPDELDTRFSTFSDVPDGMESLFGDIEDYMEEIPIAARDSVSAKDILSLMHASSDEKENESNISVDPSKFVRMYELRSLDNVISLAHVLNDYYRGDNILYHTKEDAPYYLILHIGDHSATEYNKVCNIAAEYGTLRRITSSTESYFGEHSRPLLSQYALQQLVRMPSTSENC